MSDLKLNGGTAWLVRLLFTAFFAIAGYFINQNDKAIEVTRTEQKSLETRFEDHLSESNEKETVMADRLARIEEQIKETNRILRAKPQ